MRKKAMEECKIEQLCLFHCFKIFFKLSFTDKFVYLTSSMKQNCQTRTTAKIFVGFKTFLVGIEKN